MTFEPPGLLRPTDDPSGFDSGVPILDEWLRKRALRNEQSGASRTYVIRVGGRVVAYYSLSAGSTLQSASPGRVRRNMPDPIPVIVLGRLAVDKSWQGKGLGRGLLRDAVLRAVHVSHTAGVRALLVHAISQDARRFYLSAGFQESPADPMTLMITLNDAMLTLDL